MAKRRLEQLEAQLLAYCKKGNEKDVYNGGFGGGHLHAGSFAEVEAHEAERKRLAALVKEARAEAKAEKKSIKGIASSSNDPSTWTKKLLDGDANFTSAEDGIERDLAQATVGLVSASDFRETKERLEREKETAEETAAAEAARKAEQDERERKKRRKADRKQQASKLSFEDDDG